MKKLLIIALALLNFNAFGQKKTDWEELGLKGKVKRLREIPYKAIEKEGKVQKGLMMASFLYDNVFFDEQGKKMEDMRYVSGDNLKKNYTSHQYDEQGNLIEGNWYDSEGGLSMRITYKYDDKGNKIEENWYNSDGSLDKRCTYKYDEKGSLIEQNTFNSKGSLFSKWTYIYDEQGNPIEENNYNSDGSLDSKYTYQYEYDSQGNWIKKIGYENDKPNYIIEREIEYYQN